jgi:hypothetical protein
VPNLGQFFFVLFAAACSLASVSLYKAYARKSMSRARFVWLVVVGTVAWVVALAVATFLYLISGFAPK